MPMWRCPHCRTPQAEASRCWVCKRSSTSCGTCRNFRRSIAGQLGYCGLDRRRLPLRGDEMRGCWESPEPLALEPSRGGPAAPRQSSRPIRDFVPIEAPSKPVRRSRTRPSARAQAVNVEARTAGLGLWGNLED